MRKKIISFLLCFLLILISSVSFLFADDTITITTYYPSPYGSYNDLYVANKLGIGTASPTAQLEVVCPSGFTNVKGGTPVHQLGCMQTAEQGTGTWLAASNTCFTAYGGRLPTPAEWYVTMNNYALTGEAGNYEWTNDSYSYSTTGGFAHIVMGNGSISDMYGYFDSETHAYRCWITR